MATKTISYELDRTDPNFEHVRLAGLRTFEVRLESGLWVQVVAHNFAVSRGVLSFITVCADGRLAPESFNVGEWRHYRETTSEAQRSMYRIASDRAVSEKVDAEESELQQEFLKAARVPRRAS